MTPSPAAPAWCESTDVTLESSNARLQEISTEVYERLDCESAEPLESQLLTFRNSVELTKTADEESWHIEWNKNTDEADMERAVMALIDGWGPTDYQTCAIWVSDEPRTKSLYCYDVTAPLPGG